MSESVQFNLWMFTFGYAGGKKKKRSWRHLAVSSSESLSGVCGLHVLLLGHEREDACCVNSRCRVCVWESLTTPVMCLKNTLQGKELDFSLVCVQSSSYGMQTILRMWDWAGLSLTGKKALSTPRSPVIDLWHKMQSHINSCLFCFVLF